MPADVDRAIEKVRAKGHSKSSAIRILKASGAIRQKGRHLARGKRKHRALRARRWISTPGGGDGF